MHNRTIDSEEIWFRRLVENMGYQKVASGKSTSDSSFKIRYQRKKTVEQYEIRINRDSISVFLVSTNPRFILLYADSLGCARKSILLFLAENDR